MKESSCENKRTATRILKKPIRRAGLDLITVTRHGSSFPAAANPVPYMIDDTPRQRRRSFFIPLNAADALELDRWAESPISFSSTRWKKPIARHNPELYLYSPRAAAYSGNSIRARWGRWLNRTPAGKALCDRWRAWLADRVKRYEWEIDPDDARGPTIHGLRGTGILARHADGYDVDQIANDIGMSSQMVERYMRFKDQMEIAERGRARLRLIDRKP
jgi:hypothetical protein